MKPKLPLPVLALILFLLPSCAVSDGFRGGSPITAEGLESVSEAVFATEEPETEPVIETVAEAESYAPDIVHWTAGGTVYHLDPGCYHLARAETVYHGRREAAGLAGKEKACSHCGEETST